MAKIWLDRLKKKYGWRGKNYRKLVSQIVVQNTENIHNAVGRILVRDLKEKAKTLRTGKQILIPDVTDVLPKRAVHLRKAAEKGELLTDTLRDRLTKNLREVLNTPDYEHRRGPMAGAVKESLIADFQDKITQVFDGYTKRHGKDMPSNLATIARTEVRSTVSVVKHEYMEAMMKKNPDLVIEKVWIHRGSKRKGYVPRGGHQDLDGVQVGFDEDFEIENETTGATHYAKHPHDDSLPPEEVINCGCEMKYILVERKK